MQVLTLMRSRHYPFRVEGGARSSALFVPSAIIASRLLLDGSCLNLATKVRPCSSSARRSSMNLTTHYTRVLLLPPLLEAEEELDDASS